MKCLKSSCGFRGCPSAVLCFGACVHVKSAVQVPSKSGPHLDRGSLGKGFLPWMDLGGAMNETNPE